MRSTIWRRLAGGAMRLYPAAWRERYEAEVRALLDATPPTWRVASDLLAGALRERSPLLFAPIWFLGIALRAFALTLLLIVVLSVGFVLLIGPFLSVNIGFDWSEWASRRIFDVPRFMTLGLPMFFLSLQFSLPVLLLLLWPPIRRRHPVIARVIFTAAFGGFSIWLGYLNPQSAAMLMCGWLIAVKVFPTSTSASAGPPLSLRPPAAIDGPSRVSKSDPPSAPGLHRATVTS